MIKSCKNKLVFYLVVLLLISGCGGRAANPVMVAQYGDNKRSCEALQVGMSQTQQEISRLVPETEKAGMNTALGVTGVFLIVPLFFMDFTESERIELNAYRQRYNHLAMIAMDKDCGYDTTPIQNFEKPKVEEKKKEDLFKDDGY
jgi:hypothetical protein